MQEIELKTPWGIIMMDIVVAIAATSLVLIV